MEVEHTLDDEPEMLIRDPVVKDIVVEALFEFSGVKSTPTLDVVFFDDRRWSSTFRQIVAMLT